MRLSKKATNEISNVCEEVIGESLNMFHRFIQKDSEKDAMQTLIETKKYALDKINSVKTAYLRAKNLKNFSNYVAPITKSMGLKWKTSIEADSDLPNHQLIQTSF